MLDTVTHFINTKIINFDYGIKPYKIVSLTLIKTCTWFVIERTKKLNFNRFDSSSAEKDILFSEVYPSSI